MKSTALLFLLLMTNSHDFYPLSYEEVKAIMKTKKWLPGHLRRQEKKD